MNIAGAPPLLGTNMQLQNESHLQPNSCFDGTYNWTKDVTVTLHHDKRRWVTALMNLLG